MEKYFELLKRKIVSALGCAEPVACVPAVSRAREELGVRPERIELKVLRNISKNAMNIGVPGMA